VSFSIVRRHMARMLPSGDRLAARGASLNEYLFSPSRLEDQTLPADRNQTRLESDDQNGEPASTGARVI